MKNVFYKKILPAIISISMVLTICIPNGSFVTAYGKVGDEAVVNTTDSTEQIQGDSETPEVKPDPEQPNPDKPVDPEAPLDISTMDISLSNTEYLYTGKTLTPTVKVVYQGYTYKKDVDYTVTYLNAKLPGVATAVVKGIGKLTGTKNINYNINLPKAKIKNVATVGYGQNEVNWQAVKGISGYIVYRSNERDGQYKSLVNLDNDKTSWVDKKAVVPNVYYYRVRTYKDINGKRYYSPRQTGYAKKTKLLATSKLRVKSVNYNTLDVRWNKVKGATGYMIYRTDKKNGEFKKVKTLKGNSSTSFKNSGLTTGRKYYYRIIAYKDSAENPGIQSKYYACSPRVEQASWNKDGIRKYTTKVKLSWHKVDGATGYEIYKYSKSKEKYVVEARVGRNYREYTDKNLNSTSRYSYKIRAFRTVNGVRHFGSFSSVYKKIPHGWVEKNGYKLYYNKKGQLVKDLRVMLGRRSSYWIKVNKQMNVVNVFAKDSSGKYKIPVVAFRCSSGKPTPIGTFYTPAKYRWHELMGPSWGQWNTRIHEGFLFHSVYYMKKNDNKSLPVNTYNRLGQTESHGCVRLKAGDAKWIYDNCALGTKVTIYKSSNPGPYGKPAHQLLPYWHTWDPTDPTAFKYCRAHHCHGR